MEKVSQTNAINESLDTTEWFLEEAIDRIDAQLGAGYAAEHPELIVGYMRTCLGHFQLLASLGVVDRDLDMQVDARVERG